MSNDTKKSEAYARVLAGLGRFTHFARDNQRTIDLMNESLEIWRQSKNPREEAIVLGLLGKHASFTNDHKSGLKYNERGLEIARKIGDPGLMNNCLADLCQCVC